MVEGCEKMSLVVSTCGEGYVRSESRSRTKKRKRCWSRQTRRDEFDLFSVHATRAEVARQAASPSSARRTSSKEELACAAVGRG
jgi:hypothetical protein